jgi:uncharacterized membrane protein
MPNSLLNVAARSAAGSSDVARRAAEYIPAQPTNVGDAERMVTAAVGAALVGYGISGKETSWLSLAAGGLLLYRAASGHCSVYKALGVNTAAGSGPATVIPADHGVRVEVAVTVNKPAAELYRFWRRFDNLPRFMNNLKEVRVLDGNRSHWVAKGPLGVSVEWDAEIITDSPNEGISWKSLPGADVDTSGSVHFRPAGGGTEVRVNLKYLPPAGKLGAAAAKLFGRDPETEIREDLERFKRLMEAGEINAKNGR